MKKQNWMVLLRSTDNRASEQLIDVLRIIPHRRFDGITLNYDVAIVVLKSEPDMYKHPISVSSAFIIYYSSSSELNE